MRKIFDSKGFTLVELLAVMIVLITVGTVIGSILSASLRGANKTNVIVEARQNGNYAITLMSKMIRNAKTFDGVSLDGTNYDARCTLPPVGIATPTPLPTKYKYLKITSFDNGSTVFVCCYGQAPLPATIASNSGSLTCSSPYRISLLNTDMISMPNDSCSFTCTRDSLLEPQRITIEFSLTQKETSDFVERLASPLGTVVPFKTSVVIRNFKR